MLLNRYARIWQYARKTLFALFIIALLILISRMAQRLDWAAILQALDNYPPEVIALGGLLTLGSYATYSCFDLIAKYHLRHPLQIRHVLPVTFVCYAFTQNLSAWVGGIALRYRLYGRLGLRAGTVTGIFTLGLLTNWVSYLLLSSLCLLAGWIELPGDWQPGRMMLKLIGAGLLLSTGLYLLACSLSRTRCGSLFGRHIELPPLRLAILQLLLGSLNWLLMAGVIHLLLLRQVPFGEVLATLLLSSMAGVISHIPAGLGVTETVFLTVLSGQLDQGSIMAALIAYRALYFLLPLMIAALVYLLLEKRAGQLRKSRQSP